MIEVGIRDKCDRASLWPPLLRQVIGGLRITQVRVNKKDCIAPEAITDWYGDFCHPEGNLQRFPFGPGIEAEVPPR